MGIGASGGGRKETTFTIEATPIKFGPGASRDVGWELGRLGVRRAMLVSDPGVARAGITGRITELIDSARIECVVFDRVAVEPTLESFAEACDFAVGGGFDGFVGLGGGSSLDTAKAAALVATHPAPIMDYAGALKQQRQLSIAPREAGPSEPATIFRQSMLNW